MKKLSLFSAVLCLILLTAVGCQKKDSAPVINCEKLAQSMTENLSFDDQLESIEEDTALELYGIDKKDVKSDAVYMGTGATAEEVAVFAAADEDAAGRIAGQMQARIKDQTEAFRNYVPAELPKLKDAIVSISGSNVVFCVSRDAKQTQDFLDLVYTNNGDVGQAVKALKKEK